MAFDWRNFFLHAHQLRGSSDETIPRAAIGRAYYYAYNATLTSATNR